MRRMDREYDPYAAVPIPLYLGVRDGKETFANKARLTVHVSRFLKHLTLYA